MERARLELYGAPFAQFYTKDTNLKSHSLAIEEILEDFPNLKAVFRPYIAELKETLTNH